ncbi:MAG: stage II sporulation protein M [Bacilli bacterium]|nr:stage II sporulation protein M [Bacilli bacterium]
MNIGLKRTSNSIIKQKKVYVFLISLITIALVSGIFFWFMLSNDDKILITSELTNFFNCIKKGTSINYWGSLLNSIITNLLYIILIWLLGISIIGLPIILIMIAIKSFIIGFSISSIIAVYGFKGILGSIVYIFPHQIGFLLLLLLLGFYSISFCIKLFKYLFLKQIINFKVVMRRYLKILILSVLIAVMLSLFETLISTYLIKLFTTII